MGTEDLSGAIHGLLADSATTLMDQYMPKQAIPADWDLDALAEAVQRDFNVSVDPKFWLKAEPELEEAALRERILQDVQAGYDAKVARTGAPIMRQIEKQVMLQKVDHHWREHLAAMDYLRQGIHLRGYAQKDPKFEFKREAFELFSAMLDRIKFETASLMATLEVRTQEEIEREEEERRERLMRALQAQHPDAGSMLNPGAAAAAPGLPQSAPAAEPATPFVREERKVGRNEPCPCGSGKKYKHCHGTL
jgi:preprotein translocase subunit SecA